MCATVLVLRRVVPSFKENITTNNEQHKITREEVPSSKATVLNKAWKNVDDKVFMSVSGNEIKRYEDR